MSNTISFENNPVLPARSTNSVGTKISERGWGQILGPFIHQVIASGIDINKLIVRKTFNNSTADSPLLSQSTADYVVAFYYRQAGGRGLSLLI